MFIRPDLDPSFMFAEFPELAFLAGIESSDCRSDGTWRKSHVLTFRKSSTKMGRIT
jgi:hypothetical protein